MTASASSSRSEISTTSPRLRQRVGDLMQRPGDVRAAADFEAIERDEQVPQMSGLRARRQRIHDAIAESDEPDAVALPVHQIAERRREAGGVVELRDAARGVCHRSADVDEQLAVKVGFLFELLDVVAVAPRVDLPVHRGEVVAGDVLAVLGELDAEALERDCGAGPR